ncbi:SAR2788 family putative toxin [Bacillus manliponensis]|uniref:SAR2788 family putative toxin n=1 Tax=Bacillus manliponensis TaxID=574376 RepID=UPI000AAA265C|nr:SAR2788 family putative toxin [Bacillus manliponensis]
MKKFLSLLLALTMTFMIFPKDFTVQADEVTPTEIDLDTAEKEVEEQYNMQVSEELLVNIKEENEQTLTLETNIEKENLKVNAEVDLNKENHEITVLGEITDENGQISNYEYDMKLHAVKDEVFIATLTDTKTGEEYLVDSTKLEASAAPLVPIILGLVAKKAIQKAIKDYGKDQVKKAVLSQLKWPKTISGKDLIKMLKKVGFEEVRQKGSHVTMKGPNGNTFTVPLHKELAKGTYNSIKKSVENSIV